MIAIDVDDCLCSFTVHAFTFHGVTMPDKVDYWCEKTMNAKLGFGWFHEKIAFNAEFWDTLPVLSNPKDIDFKVDYYMSAFPEEMYQSRINWLKKHGFPEAPLICTADKLNKCKELGVSILIDDKALTIQKLQGTRIKGIHFINHYAGFESVGDFVVTNLNQVKKFL